MSLIFFALFIYLTVLKIPKTKKTARNLIVSPHCDSSHKNRSNDDRACRTEDPSGPGWNVTDENLLENWEKQEYGILMNSYIVEKICNYI